MEETQRHSWIVPIPYVILVDYSLTPLARLIAAEIFALISYEKPYYYGSNKHFAGIFHCSERSVSRCIGELVEKGYFRLEIDKEAGNIRRIYPSDDLMSIKGGMDKNSDSYRQKSQKGYRQKSLPENDSKENVKLDSSKELGKTPDPPPKTGVEITGQGTLTLKRKNGNSNGYGDPRINELLAYTQEKLGLPVFDGTIKSNRQYAYNLLRKFKDLEKCKLMVDAVAINDFWKHKITSMQSLYYNGVRIVSESRDQRGGTVTLERDENGNLVGVNSS